MFAHVTPFCQIIRPKKTKKEFIEDIGCRKNEKVSFRKGV